MKKAFAILLLCTSLLLTLLLLSPRTASSIVLEEEPTFNTADFYVKEKVSDEIDLSNVSEPPAFGIAYRYEFVSSTKYRKKFIGHTDSIPAWSKASDYSVTAKKNFTANRRITHERKNVDLFSRISIERDTVFTADDSRFSTLGLFADFTIHKVKVTRYDPYSGQPTGTTYTTGVTYENFYMQLVYK